MSEQDETVRQTEDKSAESREAERKEEPEQKEKPVRKREPEQGEKPVRKREPEQGERPVRRREPEQSERPVRRARPEQGERPVRRTRPEQGERPVRRDDAEQGERPVRRTRPEQGERPVRRKEPEQGERPVRRTKPELGERPVRRDETELGERPVRRDDPERRERPIRGDDPERRERPPQRRRPEYDDQEDFDRWAQARERRIREQREKERKKKKVKKILKWTILPIAILFLLFVMGTLAVNGYMLLVERRNILTPDEWEDYAREEGTDCILVLGCSVIGNSEPSDDLRGRLDMALELYRRSPHKILVSGDHSADGYYNEVRVMKEYLVENGVPSSDIFMDHYGFSTYDSIYRAKHCFGIHRVTVVTQDFHLYRAVFLARAIGMETVGVASNSDSKEKVSKWNLREVFARDKDFLSSLFWPDADRMGDEYDITGDGDLTNDR